MVSLFAIAFSKAGLFVIGLAGGFGLGRVKNKATLAKAQGVINTAEAATVGKVETAVKKEVSKL